MKQFQVQPTREIDFQAVEISGWSIVHLEPGTNPLPTSLEIAPLNYWRRYIAACVLEIKGEPPSAPEPGWLRLAYMNGIVAQSFSIQILGSILPSTGSHNRSLTMLGRATSTKMKYQWNVLHIMGRLGDLADLINRISSLPTWMWMLIFIVVMAVYIALTAYVPP